MSGGINRRLLLLSSSSIHGSGYMEYCRQYITDFMNRCNVTSVLFIPYALRKQDDYANKVGAKFTEWGFNFSSIHKSGDPISAIEAAECIYVGGGNTFQLLKSLYDNQLVQLIRDRVLQEGLPYMGVSAGTNVSTRSICTTNDMPIVYPPSFDALQLVPFNINPHYIDSEGYSSTHRGETREERIQQYHEIPNMPPVVGLREGDILIVDGDRITLRGIKGARIFTQGEPPREYPVNSDLSFLFRQYRDVESLDF